MGKFDKQDCPFCFAPVARLSLGQDLRGRFVVCTKCGCNGPPAHTNSKAWAAWNARALAGAKAEVP